MSPPSDQPTCMDFDYSISDRHVNYIHIVNITTCVLNILLSMMATLENSLVISSIWKNRTLHSPSNVFICCLACTDLLTGLFVQPSLVVYKIAEIRGDFNTACLWFIISFLAGNVVSLVTLLTLTGIAVDRFLAVHLHLKYPYVVTIPRVLKTFALFWVIALLPIVIRLLTDTRAYSVVVAVLLSLCFSLCFISFFRIFQITRRHRRQIRDLSAATTSRNINQQAIDAIKVRRSSITMLLIAGTFYLSYLPLLGFMIAMSIHSYTSPIKAWANIAKTIVFLGSSLNPCLYCWRMRDIRRAMLVVVLKVFRRPVSPFALTPSIATERRKGSQDDGLHIRNASNAPDTAPIEIDDY